MLYKNNRTLILYTLFLFILSAIYGLVLRFNFAFPSNIISYKNMLQGHSHVAFLGWGYLVVIGLILKVFLHKSKRDSKVYKITLGIIIATISLMLFSFILSGYKMFSIVLLSIFGLTSYVLSFKLLKDLIGKTIADKLVKYGIYYYLISSLATWFLAYVIVSQGKTELYYNTVYFYLHFLYNGFFVFGLFGLLFKAFENKKISISENYKKYFFVLLNIACIPAYILSILWSSNNLILNIIGFLASILQVISLLFLFKILKQVFKQINWIFISNILLTFSITAYSLKIIAQIVSAFPYFVEKSLALKPFFIIGYLHLFTLAFMSVLIFFLLKESKFINFNKSISKTGIILFILGVFLTEITLFLQGFLILLQLKTIENYTIILFVFSLLIVIGLILIFIGQFKKKAVL
jgi:hypothetical protein